jgi:hypothetical protein
LLRAIARAGGEIVWEDGVESDQDRGSERNGKAWVSLWEEGMEEREMGRI